MLPQCCTCRFWRATDDDADDPRGECRRRAPAPEVDISDFGSLRAAWPQTLLTDGCGEHEEVR